MNAAETTMTLVFKRVALERLAEPASVFEDARRWTEGIGIVSDDDPERLASYADREELDPDFLSSVTGQTGGLAILRQQLSTDRHVFVGTTDEDRQFAESLGWEFLGVRDAAEAADWTLAADAGRWDNPGDK